MSQETGVEFTIGFKITTSDRGAQDTGEAACQAFQKRMDEFRRRRSLVSDDDTKPRE